MTFPAYPAAFWITAALSVILVGMAKAGFGGGVGTVATPLMALTISVTDAAAIMLPILIVADIFSIQHYWNRYDRASLRRLAPGAVVGIALGAAFFGYFSNNESMLRVGLGVLALSFVAFQAGRSMLAGALEKTKPNTASGVLLGAVAGFTSTLAHAGGPPATIYLLPQKLPRDIYVGTNVIFFAFVNLVKLAPYAFLGLLGVGNLATILILAPLAFLGVKLGIALNRYFNERWFNRLVYALLFVTGLELMTGQSIIRLLF